MPTADDAVVDQSHPTPDEEVSLSRYVDVCRALVREGGDSARGIEAVLLQHRLSAGQWADVRAMWTGRIRRDADVRAEFQRLYAGLGRETGDAK